MFSCGGENIYPKEVEDLLFRHPAVVNAVVAPVPHAVKGYVPAAMIVLNKGATATAADRGRAGTRKEAGSVIRGQASSQSIWVASAWSLCHGVVLSGRRQSRQAHKQSPSPLRCGRALDSWSDG